MVMLDANMILRYLLNDNVEMAEKAQEYIERDNALVTTEVIAEVVYVLKGIYSLDRHLIATTLKRFMILVNAQNREIIQMALETYGEKNLDFVDCVLYAYHRLRGMKVATFEKNS